MDDKFSPKTVVELEKWMKENCFNFNNYSINDNFIHEGYGIDKSGGLYIWYYTERGQKNNLRYFFNENEIVEYAFNEIKSNKWANIHCIGFTPDYNEHKELERILTEMGIYFEHNEHKSWGQTIFITNIFGRDLNKVLHLKEKYYKEK